MWEGVAETRRPCVSQVLRNAINRVVLYSLCLAAAQVRSIGRGRARRWLSPPLAEFTTILLLPT